MAAMMLLACGQGIAAEEQGGAALQAAAAASAQADQAAAEAQKKAQEAAKAAEEQKKAQEAAKAAEEQKKAQEAAKAAEEQKKAQEAAKAAEEQKKAQEAEKAAEEQKKAQEAAKAAEEQKKDTAPAAASASEPEKKPEEAAPAAAPEQKPEEAAPASEPEQKPEEAAPASEPEQKPEEAVPASEPEQKPEEAAPASEPEQKPEEAAPTSEPEQKPEEAAPTSEPEQKPEEAASVPEEKAEETESAAENALLADDDAKKTFSISPSGSGEIVYDGKEHSVKESCALFSIAVEAEENSYTARMNEDGAFSEVTLGDGTVIHFNVTAGADDTAKNAGETLAITVAPEVKNGGAAEWQPSQSSLQLSVRVVKSQLTIKADDKKMTVGDEEPELTATIEGTYASSDKDMIDQMYSLSREEGDRPGIYAITVASVDNTEPDNYEIEYKPGKLTIYDANVFTVQIVWDDEFRGKEDYDALRPPSVWVTLLGEDYEVKASDGWTCTVKLPLVDDVGNPVDYTEAEWLPDMVMGYTSNSTIIPPDNGERLTIFTFTHEVHQLLTKQMVRITWDDEDNKMKARPGSVTFALNSGETVTLNEANNWEGIIENLPVHRDGTRYVYEWEVIPDVKDYAAVSADLDSLWDATGEIVEGEVLDVTYECLLETVKTSRTDPVLPGHHVLTINYYYKNGNSLTKARESYVAVLETGASYYEKTPEIAGYTASRAEVSGKLTMDRTFNIYYTPNVYTLTVRYRYQNGSQAAPPHTEKLTAGSSFNVKSPEISGYKASAAFVSGEMPAQNLTQDVYYTKNSSGNNSGGNNSGSNSSNRSSNNKTSSSTSTKKETVIEDYPTPLGQGVGAVTINAGECFE